MSENSQNNVQEQTDGGMQLKNHNPNRQHNTKKESLGPNTRR